MAASVVTLTELLGKPEFQPTKRLEGQCERTIIGHVQGRRASDIFPVTTDDLTTLLEQHVEELNLYADVTRFGQGVEGLTLFQPSKKPIVMISAALAEAKSDHRLRSTLAHEFGHVLLHDPVFQRKSQESLFDANLEVRQVCYRDGFRTSGGDLYEYQAWLVCGALLMPLTELSRVVDEAATKADQYSDIYLGSDLGVQVVDLVARRFAVSPDLARIRLLRASLVTETEPSPSLF